MESRQGFTEKASPSDAARSPGGCLKLTRPRSGVSGSQLEFRQSREDRVRLTRGPAKAGLVARYPEWRTRIATLAAIVWVCSCLFSTAGENLFSWKAATKLHCESEFARGDDDWVALPATATSQRITGTFDVVSDSKFVLRETEAGVNRNYTGTYVPRLHGKAMQIRLDKAGRTALADKIQRTVKAKPLDTRVTIQSVAVHLNNVSEPLLHRPKAGEKQKVSFTGTGTYRAVWRYFWVWPLPTYYGSTTWRFDFRESLVVGPGP